MAGLVPKGFEETTIALITRLFVVAVGVGVAVLVADTVAEGKGEAEQSPQTPLPSTGQTEYQYVLPSVGLLCV